jgi:divalent metal cation (Fe/Co/Zn/Cd) transporter
MTPLSRSSQAIVASHSTSAYQIMPVLFYLKYQTGKSLGSISLMADSKQTLACAMLSIALLIGLGLNYLFGIWQADPAIGLVIVVILPVRATIL